MSHWEGRLAVTIACAAVILAVGTCTMEPARSAPMPTQLAVRGVLCPANWRATVSQRIDVRDRRGLIVRSYWVTRCY